MEDISNKWNKEMTEVKKRKVVSKKHLFWFEKL